MDKNKKIPLSKRLEQDFRAKLLENSEKLTYADENLKLNNGHIYSGPFYCEQASNGDFTSTDCNVVLNAEHEAVKNSDVYFALFDQKFSVGTIVVKSSYNKGGTWAGAIENIKKGYSPICVYNNNEDGNKELINMGAKPIDLNWDGVFDEIIPVCVGIKRDVVAEDELDTGKRMRYHVF